ncbi:MAG TPA: CHRD domain-containing protein [Sphingomicrobium sp.]|nr:CHRD domain-containing protein [Sphingomicrobium sp.]
MASKARLLFTLAAGTALVGAAVASPVPQGGRKFTTQLNGANECNAAGTCNLGDTDGTGTAEITINVGQQRVCWDLTVNDIATPTRAHIHRGASNSAGGIVVSFFEATPEDLDGCTPTTQPVDRALLTEILQHPERFYVNVHNADFPGGAIRGQLDK